MAMIPPGTRVNITQSGYDMQEAPHYVWQGYIYANGAYSICPDDGEPTHYDFSADRSWGGRVDYRRVTWIENGVEKCRMERVASGMDEPARTYAEYIQVFPID